MVHFEAAILILKMEENMQYFQQYYALANILKISKSIVIGENKKRVLFYGKTYGLFYQPSI